MKSKTDKSRLTHDISYPGPADDDVYPRSQKVSIAVFQFFEGPMHHLNEIPGLDRKMLRMLTDQ